MKSLCRIRIAIHKRSFNSKLLIRWKSLYRILIAIRELFAYLLLCFETIRKQQKYRVHTRTLIDVHYYTVTQLVQT